MLWCYIWIMGKGKITLQIQYVASVRRWRITTSSIFNFDSFGNPDWDELSILAPLYQCCRYDPFRHLWMGNIFKPLTNVAS
jgi:hypothetical protein